MVHRRKVTRKDWKYDLIKGDKVAVRIDAYNIHVKATVTGVNDNLIDVKTEDGQEFTVPAQDVLMLTPKERSVYRVSKRLR